MKSTPKLVLWRGLVASTAIAAVATLFWLTGFFLPPEPDIADSSTTTTVTTVSEKTPSPEPSIVVPERFCAEPVLVNSTEVVDDEALGFLSQFFEDRLSGISVDGCLGPDAASAFERWISDEYSVLCLSDCAGRKLLQVESVLLADEQPAGGRVTVTADLVFETNDGPAAVIEVLTMGAVPSEEGLRLMVVSANAFPAIPPESLVVEADARAVAEDLWAALGHGAWDVALNLLLNEGVSDSVQDRLGGDLWSDGEQLLENFCASATCGAPFVVAEGVEDGEPFQAVTTVVQLVDGQVVEVAVPVGSFEGVLTAGELPPDGTVMDPSPTIWESLFGGDPFAPAVAVRYGSFQWSDGTATVGWRSDGRLRWDRSVYATGDWLVISKEWSGGVFRAHTLDGSEPEIVIGRDSSETLTLVGAGMVNGGPAALLSDGRSLYAHLLETDERTLLLESAQGISEEEFVGYADTGGDVLAVATYLGDSTTVQIYDNGALKRDASERITAYNPTQGPVLSPDGSGAVITTDAATLHVPDQIVLVSTEDGAQLGVWTVKDDLLCARWVNPLGTELPDDYCRLDHIGVSIGSVTFDGVWIIAELRNADRSGFNDLSYRAVINVETNTVRIISTTTHLHFR